MSFTASTAKSSLELRADLVIREERIGERRRHSLLAAPPQSSCHSPLDGSENALSVSYTKTKKCLKNSGAISSLTVSLSPSLLHRDDISSSITSWHIAISR
jgi:hypothetical protein